MHRAVERTRVGRPQAVRKTPVQLEVKSTAHEPSDSTGLDPSDEDALEDADFEEPPTKTRSSRPFTATLSSSFKAPVSNLKGGSRAEVVIIRALDGSPTSTNEIDSFRLTVKEDGAVSESTIPGLRGRVCTDNRILGNRCANDESDVWFLQIVWTERASCDLDMHREDEPHQISTLVSEVSEETQFVQ